QVSIDTSCLKRYNGEDIHTNKTQGKHAASRNISGMNEKIQSVLNSLPHKPGIYLMKDAQGNILYVGKAISLYNRVRSYFQESTDLSPKNRSMVAKVDDIEFLVVKNEVEALVLESNYIKQYRPKY